MAGPYDDDVDHEEEGAYGVEAMCRLVAALHAKSTMPTALQLVPTVSEACYTRLHTCWRHHVFSGGMFSSTFRILTTSFNPPHTPSNPCQLNSMHEYSALA